MNDIILHHYPTSPFSEKVRLILGFKGLAWKSVFIPTVMPKPDLMPLTGGYRKTPVMQIGADIYCDSKLIARVINQMKPTPNLIPDSLHASITMQEAWSEQVLFFLVVPIVMQPEGLKHFFAKLPQGAMEYFQKDRQALFAAGSGTRPSAKQTASLLPGTLASLETQLSKVKFLHGDVPTLADFSLFHPLWFVRSNPGVAKILDPYPGLLAWYDRMAAIGHGQITPMASSDAIELARDSTPDTEDAGDFPDPNGLKIGDEVIISATDYGADPVRGRMVKSSLDEVALSREDPRVGSVVVHFPRNGFRITAAS